MSEPWKHKPVSSIPSPIVASLLLPEFLSSLAGVMDPDLDVRKPRESSSPQAAFTQAVYPSSRKPIRTFVISVEILLYAKE